MPTPTTDPVPVAPIRVAECRHCGQLFAVYAATGEVACPACEATSKVASLQIVELGVAAPVEVKVEASPTAPTPIESMGPAGEPMSIEQPVADIELPVANLVAEAPGPEADEPQRPPTVAEWLLQSEQLSEPKPTPTEPKRSLAESLGWKPGGFEVPSLAAQRSGTAARSEAQQGELADHAEPIATSLADFRFDFGATPLSEQSGPLS
jgi:hypothetical protein